MVLPTLQLLIHADKTGFQTDISSSFLSAPLFTDVGTGEVNHAIIVLSGNNGKFITSSPVIDGYDQIYINLLDENGNAYIKTFEVILVTPIETKNSGTKIELQLLGIEHNLQKIDYIKPFYGESAFTVSSDIGNYYNVNKGTLQPTLTGHNDNTNNQLPTWTVNNYDYGLNEETCYNRLLQVVDKMGASVAAGGVLDFFELDVDTVTGLSGLMTMRIYSSGSQPTTPSLITNTTSVNVGPTEGGIQAPRGFLVAAWGDAESGSLPVEYSRFQSADTLFPLHAAWDSTIAYLVDAKVQYLGVHYKCIVATSTGPNPVPGSDATHWSVITQNSQFGNIITYSPWTRNMKEVWKNSGSDHTAINFGRGFYDSNLIIWDDSSFRTDVEFATNDPSSITSNSTQKLWLYNTTDFYRGFRILCMGTGIGAFSGTDKNNVAFTNNVVEYDGTEWVVKYVTVTNMIVAVNFEGANYKFNGTTWNAVTNSSYGNDCYHPWFNFTNIAGILGTYDLLGNQLTDTSYTVNTTSAIRVEYRWAFDPVTRALDVSTQNSKNFYSIGAWLDLTIPLPITTFGGIGQPVGLLYGGAKQVSGSPDADKEPATLDTENMHLTHDGFRGFNKLTSQAGPQYSAEDYGNISSLDFFMRIWHQISITSGGTYINSFGANFKMRCILYDTSDNVVYQDFILPFNGNWTPVKLPINAFSIYRARRPPQSPFGDLIPPKALDVNNIFEWRNVKRIVIQTQDSYDDNGRYAPYAISSTVNVLGSRYTTPDIAGIASFFGRILLDLDGFRFTKPLLTISGPISDRNITPEFLQRPTMITYDQLKNDCLTQLAISKFRHVEYDLETTGGFDVPHGNSFFYLNPRIVSNRKTDGTPVANGDVSGHGDQPDGHGGFVDNTIKLVAKKIEYSLTKPSDAPGGFIRKMVGVKRFVG